MENLAQEFRFAVRILQKNRGFTIVAVLTLALAIGANTAIFSVVYLALLRPLPYFEPDRLITLGEGHRQVGCCAVTSSYPDYLDWMRTAKSFVSIAAFHSDGFTLAGVGEPKIIFGAMATANFFSTLGVKPLLGRDFTTEDELPEGVGPTVAILSYSLWRSDFSADPRVIGRTVRLDNKGVTVIGVLPPDFEFAPAVSAPLWVPLHINSYTGAARNFRWLEVIGRLAPGITFEQARAEMQAITAQLAQEYPKQDGSIVVTLGNLRDKIVGDVRFLLLILFGAVSFVLLVACANVANLLMTRTIDRRKEFAIRSALGASRARLLLQMLTESLLLSVMGAICGLLGAWLGVRLMVGAIPETYLQSMPYLRDANINLAVMGFLSAVTLLTAILFGVGPGFAVPLSPISETLKDESRGGTSGGQAGLRNMVVIAQIALSTVLLVGGGLMLKSLRTLLQQNLGFEAEHLLTFDVSLPSLSYPATENFDNPSGLRFTDVFLNRLRSLPGVQGVSATNGLPVTENRSKSRFITENRTMGGQDQDQDAIIRRVDADYFRVMKIPLIAGRYFSFDDSEDSPKVVIVNQAWTKSFVSVGESPIGKHVQLASLPNEPFRQIIGVIGDVAEDTLTAQPPPVMYFPLDQGSGYSRYLRYVMRSTSDPVAAINSTRAILHELDPELAFIQPQTMDNLINLSPAIFLRRYPFYLIGCFAGLALILATVGLYGLISYSVLRRTREIGIRLALGAQRQDILRLVLRQGVIAALVGIGIGLIGALGAARVMASLLYGVTYSAWIIFAIVAVLLLLISLAASYIPARRATKVDPIIALRNE